MRGIALRTISTDWSYCEFVFGTGISSLQGNYYISLFFYEWTLFGRVSCNFVLPHVPHRHTRAGYHHLAPNVVIPP
jgi:hypothetical protein